MANSSSILPNNDAVGASGLLEEDSQIWHNLKQAIASSSGFQSWQQEMQDSQSPQMSLDRQVRAYLRETLETLAY
ncbi:MAG: hypothetical protein AAFO04_00450 [Cyanobacteria bacterium J06592_8]